MSDEYKYYICIKCEGTGLVNEHDEVCRDCLGAGKLDWIEVIVGCKSEVIFYDIKSGDISVSLPTNLKPGEIYSIHSEPDIDNGIITITVCRDE